MITALIVLSLIVLNGLFVAAEFALISAPRSAIEQRANRGDVAAAAMLVVLNDPVLTDRFIATAQLGITFASLGLGMYGEHRLAEALEGPVTSLGLPAWFSPHVVASILALAALTYTHIVLGEMVPKTLALQHAEAAAIRVYGPMSLVRRAVYPLVLGLNALGSALLRLLGVARDTTRPPPTPEDLRSIVEESVAEGVLSVDAGAVLGELFDFGERMASEVMTPRVRTVGIPWGASPAEIRRILLTARHGRYPVYEGNLDHIRGMVLIRDLLKLLVEDRPLDAATVRPVPFVPETTRLDVVLSLMRRQKTQIAVVMDEHGGTDGLITIEDLFEEVVGEVSDGTASAVPVRAQGDGTVALGIARLDELGEFIGRPLEHDEVDTVSGLVLSLLERPPVVGDVVSWAELELRVTAVAGRGVQACFIKPVKPAPIDVSEDG
jgi:CBS domain containing-hemolysin-like protein